MPRLSCLRLCTAAIIAASAASSGCAVHGRTTPVGYAELHYGSAYGYYPSTFYGGRPVYFIDGRLMYQDGGAWRYYETEPAPLYRYRTTIRQAPPAPRYFPQTPGGYYPAQPAIPGPAPQPAPPPPSSAPPPTRVR